MKDEKTSNDEWYKRQQTRIDERQKKPTLLSSGYEKYVGLLSPKKIDILDVGRVETSNWNAYSTPPVDSPEVDDTHEFKLQLASIEDQRRDMERGPLVFSTNGRLSQALISEKAYRKILDWESGVSEGGYRQRPEIPHVTDKDSGVTIGIGYDLGHRTAKQFREDWAELISPEDFKSLAVALGKKGSDARNLRAAVAKVRIPLDKAIQVFRERSLPEFTRLTLEIYPGAEKLSPDALGALVSMTFNRGEAFGADQKKVAAMNYTQFQEYLKEDSQFSEKRMIRYAIETGAYDDVPALIDHSKRLWVDDPGKRGLVRRREEEAELFSMGQKEQMNWKRRERGFELPAP